MPKFSVYGEITISAYTIVEAETKEEAMEIAAGREVMSMPALNRNQFPPTEMWISDELDGEPQNIRIED